MRPETQSAIVGLAGLNYETSILGRMLNDPTWATAWEFFSGQLKDADKFATQLAGAIDKIVAGKPALEALGQIELFKGDIKDIENFLGLIERVTGIEITALPWSTIMDPEKAGQATRDALDAVVREFADAGLEAAENFWKAFWAKVPLTEEVRRRNMEMMRQGLPEFPRYPGGAAVGIGPGGPWPGYPGRFPTSTEEKQLRATESNTTALEELVDLFKDVFGLRGPPGIGVGAISGPGAIGRGGPGRAPSSVPGPYPAEAPSALTPWERSGRSMLGIETPAGGTPSGAARVTGDQVSSTASSSASKRSTSRCRSSSLSAAPSSASRSISASSGEGQSVRAAPARR